MTSPDSRQGTILTIAYGTTRGLPRPLHMDATLQPGHGIVGDHRAGRSPERALNILDDQDLAALNARGYPVAPGSLGENLVVRGLPVADLPPGTWLQLGPSAVARIVKARTGCDNLKYISPDFPAAGAGHVGVMCTVERGGDIRVGDPVRVLDAAAGDPWPDVAAADRLR
jgi:MOSC domain-containing protein YiiM